MGGGQRRQACRRDVWREEDGEVGYVRTTLSEWEVQQEPGRTQEA